MRILFMTLILFCILVSISFSQDIVELNKDNFQKEVLESDKLIVIDFWAEWCKYCKQLDPIIERLIVFNQQYNRDKIRWFKIDVDKDTKFLNNFRPFRGLPVLVFFKNGKEVDRIIGLSSFLKIQDKIKFLLKEEKKEKKEKEKDNCDGGVCEPPEKRKVG